MVATYPAAKVLTQVATHDVIHLTIQDNGWVHCYLRSNSRETFYPAHYVRAIYLPPYEGKV